MEIYITLGSAQFGLTFVDCSPHDLLHNDTDFVSIALLYFACKKTRRDRQTDRQGKTVTTTEKKEDEQAVVPMVLSMLHDSISVASASPNDTHHKR